MPFFDLELIHWSPLVVILISCAIVLHRLLGHRPGVVPANDALHEGPALVEMSRARSKSSHITSGSSTSLSRGSAFFAGSTNARVRGGLLNNHRGEINAYHFTTPNTSSSRARSSSSNTQSQNDVIGPIVQRSNRTYESQLMLKGRGYPLWIPQPNLNLPIPYRTNGTRIGDVGLITSYGSFDFLFNIFLSHDDPSNPEELPDGFQPIHPPLTPTAVGRFREFSSGSFLASSSVARVYTDSPASGLIFESSDVEGAILAMPDGACHEQLGNISRFRPYIATHAEDWYKFVNGPRGREAKNGDIRLVVGCDKATTWGMATFANNSQTKMQLKFRPPEQRGLGLGCTHFWEHSTMAEVRVGPEGVENDELGATPEQPLRNQCLFVRTLNVMLAGDVWAKLDSAIQTMSNLDHGPSWIPFDDGQTSPTERHRPSDKLPDAYKEKTYSGSAYKSIRVTEFAPAPSTVHPSQILNEFLLSQKPEATMAITHDRDWYSIVSQEDMDFPDPPTFIRRIEVLNDICEDDGVVYLCPKGRDQQAIAKEQEKLTQWKTDFGLGVDHALFLEYLFGHVNGPKQSQILEVIEELTNCLSSTPHRAPGRGHPSHLSHPDRLLILDDLLRLIQGEFVYKDVQEESIPSQWDQLNLSVTNDSDPSQSRVQCLLRLGNALQRRYSRLNLMDDLEDAISCFTQAASLSSPSHYRHLEAKLGLASSRFQRYQAKGQREDLVILKRTLEEEQEFDVEMMLQPLFDKLFLLKPQVKLDLQMKGDLKPQVPVPLPLNKNHEFLVKPSKLYRAQGLQVLRQYIAVEGMHDAGERFPAPACHFGTRVEVLRLIEGWISNPQPPDKSRLFWLNGGVGVGKSAIMQETANALLGMDKEVSASFFFGRGKGKRESGKYLFPTIAYQLATYIPEIRRSINSAIELDPTLPTKDLRAQFQSLIAGPFQQANSEGAEGKFCQAMLPGQSHALQTGDNSLHQYPSSVLSDKVVLIDGLDECHDHGIQQAIVDIIGKANIPIRFVITSRPEPHIAEAFRGPCIKEQTREVNLDDMFPAREDIYKYYTYHFDAIRQRTIDVVPNLPIPWPSRDVISELLQMASGQFVLATAIVEFVADPDELPTLQLETILDPSRRSKAFSSVDSLYAQILSTHPDPKLMKSMLGVVLGHPQPLAIILIEDILQRLSGEILMAVRCLSSLLKVRFFNPDESHLLHSSPTVTIMYTSFRDYITDAERSRNFYVNPTDYENILVWDSFARLSHSICILNSQRDLPSMSMDRLGYLTNLSEVPLPNAILGHLKPIAAEFKRISQAHRLEGDSCDLSWTAFRSLSLILDILDHKDLHEDEELADPYRRLFSSHMHLSLHPGKPLGHLLIRFPEFAIVSGPETFALLLGLESLEEQGLFLSLFKTMQSTLFEGDDHSSWEKFSIRIFEFIRHEFLSPAERQKRVSALVIRWFPRRILCSENPAACYWNSIDEHFEHHLATNAEILKLLRETACPTYCPELRSMILKHLNSLTFCHLGLRSAPLRVAGYIWNSTRIAFALVRWNRRDPKIQLDLYEETQNLAKRIRSQVLDVEASGAITLSQPFLDYLLYPDDSRHYNRHMDAYDMYCQTLGGAGYCKESTSVSTQPQRNESTPPTTVLASSTELAEDKLPTLSPYLFLFDLREWGLASDLSNPAASPLYVGPLETLKIKLQIVKDFIQQPDFEKFNSDRVISVMRKNIAILFTPEDTSMQLGIEIDYISLSSSLTLVC